jgi:hypothetical protein
LIATINEKTIRLLGAIVGEARGGFVAGRGDHGAASSASGDGVAGLASRNCFFFTQANAVGVLKFKTAVIVQRANALRAVITSVVIVSVVSNVVIIGSRGVIIIVVVIVTTRNHADRGAQNKGQNRHQEEQLIHPIPS